MKVDVAQVLDEGNWTTYQKMLVAGTALAVILDGIDIQLLGNAIPSLMKEWGLPREAFSTALAMSPLGMIFGGVVGGWLGDRIGRRNALLLSVVSFAVLTMVNAAAGSVVVLCVLRFLAGLGLGGATPNAAALASEYVPRRHRPFAVTLTIVCIPLGGMLAAFLSARVIPDYGWRTLFLVGGIAPFLLSFLLFAMLPESPRFLAHRHARWPELIALMRKLGHEVGPDVAFVDAGVAHTERPRVAWRHLFAPDIVRDTLGLFVAFFFCLLANFVGFLLLVPILTGIGFTQPAASSVLGWWNIGGVAGALVGALFIQRLGSRATMLGLCLIAIASAFILAAMPLDPESPVRLIVMSIILGGSLNAVQTTLYALAAHVYPTHIRGTGIGTTLMVGRFGNVLASYVGTFAFGVGGLPAYFATFGIAMIVVFVALMVIRRHIERTVARPALEEIATTGV